MKPAARYMTGMEATVTLSKPLILSSSSLSSPLLPSSSPTPSSLLLSSIIFKSEVGEKDMKGVGWSDGVEEGIKDIEGNKVGFGIGFIEGVILIEGKFVGE